MCRPTKRPRPVVAAVPVMPLKAETGTSFVGTADLDNLMSLTDLLAENDDMFMTPTMDNTNAIAADGSDVRPKTFVFTAYDMVNNPENAAAVGFNAEGTALEIRDLVLLSEKILPKYFRHKNVTSFYRQLNSYGFRTIRSSSADIAHTFSHDLFKKDRPDLLNNIFRKKCCPKEKRAVPSTTQNGSSSDSTPVTSPSTSISSSPDSSCQAADAPIVTTVVAAPELSEAKQVEELRLNQLKAKEQTRALEARNRNLLEENKSILMESERIFQKMNLMVEAQTAAIEKLFGGDAARAFAEQAKPFRFDFEHPAAEVKASPQIQAQAQDFNDFVDESNDLLFQDDELQMLENIFQGNSGGILA